MIKYKILQSNFVDKKLYLFDIIDDNFLEVEDIKNADIIFSPISLNYLVKLNDSDMQVFCESLKEIDVKLPIYFLNYGDYACKVPKSIRQSNVIVLSCAGSTSLQNYKGFPAMWGDPITKYFDETEYYSRQKTGVPSVGFCGLGKNTIPQFVVRFVRQVIFNAKAILNFNNYYPEAFFPGVFTRERILKRIKKSNLINENFTIHSKYKSGIKTRGTKEEFDARKRFYTNILESDYTLCIRGAGNFSIRFYETLAMGRIPIVYDTNQLFPYTNHIDYKNVGLFIDSKSHKISEIPQLIYDYHTKLTSDEFSRIAKSNRNLWLEYMSTTGVAKNFSKL
jgi:hypothetical protein